MKKVEESDLRQILPLFQNEADNYLATNKRIIQESDLRSWLKTDDQVPFVSFEAGHPVAYGEIWIDDEEGDLEFAHLITAQDYRGQGYGKKLVQSLLEEAKKYPYDDIFIRVLPENSHAIKLYVSLGFEEIQPFDERYFWMKRKNLR
ncbi:GNAT family N-acetyltransferase [Listeria fleischmannii]|uniref:GNAT family N-acetyltransferase n=1 Tax=Listeria fleischmannii TaxID=1069827 RepID=A0A841YC15_9LIST|nr:GNAT family N-acetyltransferase [Listeria fleischmannii]EIA21633.1 GCN5-related N-acetyltransferase [Listeria fleischmannii subsp. coloradonensis]MBC1397811.1 GNAT family N-acetyltransferase [Listeria fleischmannii]MBC1427424.1 GNAT family N-acetyltransferase [Listeria fleischmannii]STY33900.1 ribosomal-protein-alanine N-acetyltransferase [Listeria fleischmannii subsp. coloradonensis]